MAKKLLLLVCSMATAISFAQSSNGEKEEEFASHTVLMGETVVLVAKKYKMKPQDIYEYNPETTNGISQGTILKIPMHRQVNLTTAKPKKEVAVVNEPSQEPETESQYSNNTPVDNAVAIAIPEPEISGEQLNEETSPIIHKVQKGETLYGISKKYGVSVEQITAENKVALKHGLQAGLEIIIKTTTNR